jgi:CRISPR-associated protein Csd2
MTTLQNRYDFVLVFDVQDGNPNGDPDAGNMPRLDPETLQGLVTDVCLKRKLRNYVQLAKDGAEGYEIFIKEKGVLNSKMEEAYAYLGIDLDASPKKAEDGKKRNKKGSAQGGEVERGRAEMCRRYFDVRTFGAVMSTGPNAGQVRGPVQLTFSRSVDPIVTQEHAITRMAVATVDEAEKQGGDNRTMGRKNTIPYGLYVGHGFVLPKLAQQTGFTDEDLSLLWEALKQMFEQDRSAARGLMALRKLIVFKHATELGNAPSHALFDLVEVKRKDPLKPPRAFTDYEVLVKSPPQGVEPMHLV